MLFIQLTGLSYSGKSTIAVGVKEIFLQQGINGAIIDADILCHILCRDLGFSKADLQEKISQLGFVAYLLAVNGVIAILAAINPYEETQEELVAFGTHVKTFLIYCNLEIFIKRDTKKLCKRALFLEDHLDQLTTLIGINDHYEIPKKPDLIINTNRENKETSIERFFSFISKSITT